MRGVFPRSFLGDTGILHTLFEIDTRDDLDRHPKVGASWEGFVMREVVRQIGAGPEECFFWATHAGAELDLLVVRGSRRLGFEIKRTTSLTTTRSMHAALDSTRLNRLDVIHAGEHTFSMKERIRAVAFDRLEEDINPLDLGDGKTQSAVPSD